MKCDRDCFNCKYDDCIVNDIDHDEREAMKIISGDNVLSKYSQRQKERILQSRASTKKYDDAHRKDKRQYCREWACGSLKRKRPYKRRVVKMDVNGNDIAEYDSINAAAVDIDGSPDLIVKCCKGTRKTGYGYKWRYA